MLNKTFISAAILAGIGWKLYADSKARALPKNDRGLNSELVNHAADEIEEASMDSFPASDPPAWNSTPATTAPLNS